MTKDREETHIDIKQKEDYNAYMRQYMRKYRKRKKEGSFYYSYLDEKARPYKKRNIKVNVNPSEDPREYQRQYQRKYREVLKQEEFRLIQKDGKLYRVKK